MVLILSNQQREKSLAMGRSAVRSRVETDGRVAGVDGRVAGVDGIASTVVGRA